MTGDTLSNDATLTREQLADHYKLSVPDLNTILLQNAVLELAAVTDLKAAQPETIQEALLRKHPHLTRAIQQMHVEIKEADQVIRRGRQVLDMLTKSAVDIEAQVEAETKHK